MKVLVTGGAGFIGSALARALNRRGDEVRILDNFLTGFEENVPEGLELIRADLRDLEFVSEACKEIEVVFHHGALRSVPRSIDNPMLSMSCNVEGTLNLLVAATETGVRRVVYASSSSVYGDSREDLNRENGREDPISPYAVSKLAGEQYCRVWTKVRGLSTISLRYFNVFGPGQHPESQYAAVFPAFISALAQGRAPGVDWDGEQSRDFTFVDDVVRANLLTADAGPEADGQVINIGGGDPKTVNEVLRSVSAAMGVWIDPVHRERRPGDVRRTHADITLAGEILGWKPEADWDAAVKATVRWFLENGAGQMRSKSQAD
jgi:nucleoside-diphosphate-sugar epimerase